MVSLTIQDVNMMKIDHENEKSHEKFVFDFKVAKKRICIEMEVDVIPLIISIIVVSLLCFITFYFQILP